LGFISTPAKLAGMFMRVASLYIIFVFAIGRGAFKHETLRDCPGPAERAASFAAGAERD
jgi:hypothetical protein